MRKIEHSTVFKKDYKREKRGRHRNEMEALLKAVIRNLALDEPLEPQLRDHILVGDYHGYRECHLKPDLLLIYKKLGKDGLRLARLGSHSELFN